jgi:hypothetical protein
MLRKTLLTVLTPVLLTASVGSAQSAPTTPAPAPVPATPPLTSNDIFTALGNGGPAPGMQSLGNAFSSVDSTIAMLSRTIDLLMMVPVIGPFAAGLKPVLNTYLDMKTTIQPLIDAGNRGMEYVGRINQARETMRRIFSSNNFPDAVNNLNSLIGQFGGLGAELPAALRTIDARDPRASVARILEAADAKIAEVRRLIGQARAGGDLPRYRALLQREQDLQQLRYRIRQTGEAAATQRDNAALTARTSEAAGDAASRAQQQAINLQATVSAEGALKVLGTMAIEELNVQASGFDTLSQQLTLISQQQVVSNEQNDQLLARYQQEARQQAARNRQAVEEQTQRQADAYKSMVQRVDTLSDAIGQTLKPSSDRRSSLRDLMRGE